LELRVDGVMQTLDGVFSCSYLLECGVALRHVTELERDAELA
jgi:hypothetical protein